MRYIGFDPSTVACGWAVCSGQSIIAAGVEGCPFSKPKQTLSVDAAYSGEITLWAQRLAARVIDEHEATHVAIEKPIEASGKRSTNGSTVHLGAVMFGAIASVARLRRLSVHGIAQQSWRSQVGVPGTRLTGKAKTEHNKEQALRLCEWKLRFKARTHDEAEAALIAHWLESKLNPRLAAPGTLFGGRSI